METQCQRRWHTPFNDVLLMEHESAQSTTAYFMASGATTVERQIPAESLRFNRSEFIPNVMHF